MCAYVDQLHVASQQDIASFLQATARIGIWDGALTTLLLRRYV